MAPEQGDNAMHRLAGIAAVLEMAAQMIAGLPEGAPGQRAAKTRLGNIMTDARASIAAYRLARSREE